MDSFSFIISKQKVKDDNGDGRDIALSHACCGGLGVQKFPSLTSSCYSSSCSRPWSSSSVVVSIVTGSISL